MNQRFAEAFYWVATLKSMTRAAEKLFMTQSAISSRVPLCIAHAPGKMFVTDLKG